MRMRKTKFVTQTRKKKLFGVISTVFIIWILLQIFLPSFDILQVYERMPNLLSGKSGLIVDSEIIQSSYPIVYDNEVLLPLGVINKYIDSTIIKNDNYIICASGNTYIRYEINNNKYVINDKIKKGNAMPIEEDGVTYLPLGQIKELYGLDYYYYQDTNILVVNTSKISYDVCKVLSDSKIRETASIKSSIVGYTYIDEKVFKYETEEDWTKIISSSGMLGYVKSNTLEYEKTIKNERSKNIELDLGTTYGEVNIKIDVSNEGIYVAKEKQKLDILWYQVNSKSANPKVSELEKIPGMTHMCFTWFAITNTDGTIQDKVEPSIVRWGHNNGYKVWALVTNPFSDSTMSHEFLSNAVARENAIKQLISFCKKYDIDGINVDIESIKEKSGPYYIQFIRELSVFTKLNKLDLSIDMYMPSKSTEFYGRDKIINYIDYYCLMAYDEYWSTSEKAGSVSSLPWVERGIVETLKIVPREKLILGIPLYTRRWETDANNNVISQKALSMENSYKDLYENNATIIFNNEAGQNYGEYKKDNKYYKIWLEDEISIKSRLDLAKDYKLIGVASWKKNFEKQEIWALYEDYMK